MNRTLAIASASLIGIFIIGTSGLTAASAPVPDPAVAGAAVVAFTSWAEGESLTLDRIACSVDETGLATCYGLAAGLPVAYEAPPTGEATWGAFTALATAPSAGTLEEGLMPNVVCMDLQQAQNTIRAAGVFFSRSEDATGEGRMQVMDRNWIVVAQTPAPGTPIGEGEAVLSVVKDDEPNDC